MFCAAGLDALCEFFPNSPVFSPALLLQPPAPPMSTRSPKRRREPSQGTASDESAAAAAAAAVPASSEQEQQHGSAVIGVQLPLYLTAPVDTYEAGDSLLQQPHHFFARHRDAPAHFTSACTGLFSSEQQRQIAALFPSGWQQNTSSPLHAAVGSCRASSAHRTQGHDVYATRDASVGAFLRKARRGKQLVVSDVSLRQLPSSLASALQQGPALFHHANMLRAVQEDPAMPEQYHWLSYAIFATEGSYTAPHLDFLGADAYLYLVTGEKLWIMAPPEKKAEFDTLFKKEHRAATIRLTKAEKAYMKLHRMCAIHQRAGEAVFVPGGWPHMVKNLSDTVSFGNSYVRPWKMHLFLAFVREEGLASASRLVNVTGVIRAWMNDERQREWGVTRDDTHRVWCKWGSWIKTHVVPGPFRLLSSLACNAVAGEEAHVCIVLCSLSCPSRRRCRC